MPVTVVFRCAFCDARPGHETQLSLEHGGELKAMLREQYGLLGWHIRGRWDRTRGRVDAEPTALAGWRGRCARCSARPAPDNRSLGRP